VSISIHLNTLMIIGLLCIPGAFVAGFLGLALGAALKMEMAALAPMYAGFFGVLAPGLVMILLGIGQNLG
jgi:hypothetical protein